MTCPRCKAPVDGEVLQKLGGLCPRCLLKFTEELEAPAFPGLDIVGVLGRGGMGIVYKALETAGGRPVALKILSPRFAASPEFVERFTREARALSQLSHPDIVSIESSGIHDGVPYLVMEYVEGNSLRKEIRKGRLSISRAIEIAGQVCEAIQYAHSRGVIHRDIKPENILIRPDGRVKIADFGLAKLSTADQATLTLTQAVMGTPHYMAPEQLDPKAGVDERSDLFSLGVVFYEMLTGELPIGRFKPPSAIGADLRVDSIVLDLLERNPEDRIPTAKELRRQLKRLDKRIAIQAPPSEIPSRRRDPLATVAGWGILGLIPSLFAVLGSYLKGDLSWQANILFPFGAALALVTLLLSGAWALRMKWRPREQESIARPLVGLVLSCGMLVASAHLRWTDFDFKLDDAWPTLQELPIFVRVYGHPQEDPEPLAHLEVPPPHADVEKIRGLLCNEGRLEVLGIQFRSPSARRRWQEDEERHRSSGGGQGWAYRKAGGASIIL
ncbi:MAG TPA: serine/threonine-protein kinase, partial [Planctomycetota bacterium]|nr:serine/threonine-protein kinase [Planctomycetota bacterium]